MVLSIRNNDIYYYKFKLNNGILSWFLIPFLAIILINKKYINYFSYVCIYVAILGTIETYYVSLNYNYFYLFTASAIIHLILLYPLINIEKYFKPNIFNIFTGIIGLFIIYFLPYWPYILSRNIFAYFLIFTYILLVTIYYLNKIIKNYLKKIL